MKKSLLLLSLVGLLGSSDVATAATATVEENVIGPVGADLKYYVSPRGGHLAAVGRRGSRTSVTVDGAEGPRFDEILMPTEIAVDTRPIQLMRQQGIFGDAYTIKPVVFSKDGRRHAYVGRRSQELIVVVDGKESLTLPVGGSGGAAASLRFGLEFTGPDGTHLIFTRGGFAGYEMWVDGRKWPGIYATGRGDTGGPVATLISPDGSRIAGVAQLSPVTNSVVLDGQETGYLARNLVFSPDSKRLFGVATDGDGQTLLIDGKPTLRAARILNYFVSPVGNRIIASASESTPEEGLIFFLVVDGKRVEGSRNKMVIETVAFSPDGKRYAAVCGPMGARYVVIDGKKGQEYQGVDAKLEFTADSTKVAYIASMNTSPPTQYLVLNETESDAFYAQPRYWFSADGRRIAVVGQVDAAGKQTLTVDGKAVPFPPRTHVTSLAFSPDGQRYVVLANGDAREGAVFLDGKPTELTGSFTFSPDGRHLAVVGHRPADRKRGLFVNGELVQESTTIRFCAFTPDSRHFLWVSLERSQAKDAEPGSFDWVTYVDGEAVVRFQKSPAADQILGSSDQSQMGDHPGWTINAAGELNVVGPAGNEFKRSRIKPSASTGIDLDDCRGKSGNDAGRRQDCRGKEEVG